MSLPKFVVALAAAAVSFGSMAQFASAAVVVYEGYNGTPVGFSDPFNAPGSTGPGYATAASLVYGGLLTDGVARQGSNSAAWSGERAILAQPVDATTATNGVYSTTSQVWMSWLYKTDDNGTGGFTQWTRAVTFNSGAERVNLGLVGDKFTIRPLTSSNAVSSIVVAPNTTYMVVAKYDFGTASDNDGSITMWISPDPGSLGTGAEPTGAQISKTGLGEASQMAFNTIGLEGAAGAGMAQYDELRIGSTWSDVSPIAVPEPASIGLAALGMSACLLRRRRRA